MPAALAGLRRQRTNTAGIQWPHIENINTLHLSQNFETLETGGLFEIGGHGTGLRTRGEEVGLSVDLYPSRALAGGPDKRLFPNGQHKAWRNDIAAWTDVRSSFL